MDSEKELQLIASHLRIALRCIEQRQQQVMTEGELVELLDMHVSSAAELLALLRGEVGELRQERAPLSQEHRKVDRGNGGVAKEVVKTTIPQNEEKGAVAKPVARGEKEELVNQQRVTSPPSDPVKSSFREFLPPKGQENVQAPHFEKRGGEEKKGNPLPKRMVGGGGVVNGELTSEVKHSKEHSRTTTTLADAYAQRTSIVTNNDNTHVEESLGSRHSPLSSIQKGLTLHDKSLFALELFRGDRALFSKVVKELDTKSSLAEALQTLHLYYTGAPDLPALKDFIQILERRFS